jgi:predicted RNA-binding protein YlxR (DUF448 family)
MVPLLVIGIAIAVAFLIAQLNKNSKLFSSLKKLEKQVADLSKPLGLAALEKAGARLGGLNNEVVREFYVFTAVGERDNNVAKDLADEQDLRAAYIAGDNEKIKELQAKIDAKKKDLAMQVARVDQLNQIGDLLPKK